MRCYPIVKPLLAIFLISATSFPSWAQEDNPELRDQFLQGVAETGRKLQQRSIRAKCVQTSQMTEVSETWKAKYAAKYADKQIDPHQSQTRKFEVAIRGPLSLKSGVRKSGNAYFEGRNDAYAFSLERSPEGERPSLLFIEQLGIDPTVDARVAKLEGAPRAMALAGFAIGSKPLYQWVKSDSFSINRVYPVPSEENELVRVEFEYPDDDPAQEIISRFTDGYLICDPARHWILTEYGGKSYDYRSKSTSVTRTVLEFGELSDDIPIAIKVATSMSPLDDPGTKIEFVSIIEETGHDVPEEEFYLSHYGLPEPNFDRSWFGTWSWYLIGGVACIVIGVIIKWRMTAR